jgi:hypothetical protein
VSFRSTTTGDILPHLCGFVKPFFDEFLLF